MPDKKWVEHSENADVARLIEIKEEMMGLIEEANHIIRTTVPHSIEYERAKSYWLAKLRIGLDNGHQYAAGSMHTMQDTINELEELLGPELTEEEEKLYQARREKRWNKLAASGNQL